MLLAVLSDIHANRQAFDACLKAARARGAERMVLLGESHLRAAVRALMFIITKNARTRAGQRTHRAQDIRDQNRPNQMS